MKRRTLTDFESAMSLMEVGRGDTEIARLTGIPRPTVSAWRHGRGSTIHRRMSRATPTWRPPDREAYSYLLGVYLGVNRFKTKLPSGRVADYEYPRYFFSNLSADIRRIFCDHCNLVGIRWTQSNPRNISVAHRASVALLDECVGPKY